ncbi:MAG: UbiA family prenyltransferase [Bdellovibrionales bacterium]
MKTYVADLDGTIIKTDMLFETFVRRLRKSPYVLFLIPFWLLKGRAFLKAKLSDGVSVSPQALPYNKEVLWFLRKMKGEGHRVVLATAASEKMALDVSDHLKCFDAVYSSDDQINLKATKKREKILLEEKKSSDIIYLGDSKADFKVWGDGVNAIPVGSKRFIQAVHSKFTVERDFEIEKGGVKPYIKAIRVHQWAKNALILLPLLLYPGGVLDAGNFLICFLAILSFSLCASSVYLLNDLFDLESDRVHDKKRFRPLAVGSVSISSALFMIPLLLIGAFLLASYVSSSFFIVLICYYILTSLYSFVLKSIAVLDVMVLATLYTTRIFAGGAALGITISNWLMAFSMFFFLSLAFVKRTTELKNLKNKILDKSKKIHGRGYLIEDLVTVQCFGMVSAVVSILVFSLYVSSETVRQNYSFPEGLWFSSLILFFWITRVWILTNRGEMDDDPVVFAVKDRISYFVGVLIVINFVLSL